MRKIKLNKVLKGTFLLLATTVLLGFVTSCSSDDDEQSNAATSHKIVFKAEASSGSDIDIAVYGIDGNTTTATSLAGTTWTSTEITAPAGSFSANVAVNAVGANANSTLKVQIYVDGQLKKEGTSSGQYLSASANYNF